MNDPATSRLSALGRLDRRWIYLTLAVVLVVTLLTDLRLKDRPSALVLPLYEMIESLPPGSPILISCDYTPTTAPELEPMAYALTRHAMLKGHRVVFMSLWPEGNHQIGRVARAVMAGEFPSKRSGEDWVNLGYKSGNEMLINAMRQDLQAMYSSDADGRPVSELPGLNGIASLADFSLIVGLSAGTPGLKEWILFAGDTSGIPVGGGCNGAGTTQFLPYFPHQLLGLMGGVKGASEYEAALHDGHPDFEQRTMAATESMGPQAVAHTVIVLFVLLGNLGSLLARRRNEGNRP